MRRLVLPEGKKSKHRISHERSGKRPDGRVQARVPTPGTQQRVNCLSYVTLSWVKGLLLRSSRGILSMSQLVPMWRSMSIRDTCDRGAPLVTAALSESLQTGQTPHILMSLFRAAGGRDSLVSGLLKVVSISGKLLVPSLLKQFLFCLASQDDVQSAVWGAVYAHIRLKLHA